MIKALLFDFGGVLNNIGDLKMALDKISQKTDDEYREFIQANKKAFLKSHLYETDDFYKAIRQHYKTNIANDEICRLIIDPDYEMLSLAKKLSSYYKLFILTSITKGVMEQFQEITQTEYIQEIFETCKEHLSKQDTKLIQRVITKTGFQAHEILYIDDNKPTLEVAKILGVHTLLFENKKQLEKELIKQNIQF